MSDWIRIDSDAAAELAVDHLVEDALAAFATFLDDEPLPASIRARFLDQAERLIRGHYRAQLEAIRRGAVVH